MPTPRRDWADRTTQISPVSWLIRILLFGDRMTAQEFKTAAPAIFGRFMSIGWTFRVRPAVIGAGIGVHLRDLFMLRQSAPVIVDVFQRHQAISFAEKS